MKIDPDDVEVGVPANTDNIPPDEEADAPPNILIPPEDVGLDVALPALTCTFPPFKAPAEDKPADAATCPPWLEDEEPPAPEMYPFLGLTKATLPLEPNVEEPDVKLSAPLIPLLPLFVVEIDILPLDVPDPIPLDILIVPPVLILLRPDVTIKGPPFPLLPLPTKNLISPLLPLTAFPENILIRPESPSLVVPEAITT